MQLALATLASASVPGVVSAPLPLGGRATRVLALPNPSGRNAHFSYAEMLAALRGLSRDLEPKA